MIEGEREWWDMKGEARFEGRGSGVGESGSSGGSSEAAG